MGEQLFDQYAALPRGKEKKQQWMNSLNGHQKFELKRVAKEHEKKEMDKWQKWLNPAAPKAKPANKPKASKAKPAEKKAEEASQAKPAEKVGDEANKLVEADELGN